MMSMPMMMMMMMMCLCVHFLGLSEEGSASVETKAQAALSALSVLNLEMSKYCVFHRT